MAINELVQTQVTLLLQLFDDIDMPASYVVWFSEYVDSFNDSTVVVSRKPIK